MKQQISMDYKKITHMEFWININHWTCNTSKSQWLHFKGNSWGGELWFKEIKQFDWHFTETFYTSYPKLRKNGVDFLKKYQRET